MSESTIAGIIVAGIFSLIMATVVIYAFVVALGRASLNQSRHEENGEDYIGNGLWMDPHKYNPAYKSPKELREEKEKKGITNTAWHIM